MANDRGVPHSRRALLAGGIGGLGVVLASGLGRPSPICGADDDAMHVGGEYSASTVTKLTNLATDDPVLAAVTVSGIAIHGTSTSGRGVFGEGDECPAVEGQSNSGIGVAGHSVWSAGVVGATSPLSERAGVVGQSFAGRTGVWGYSGEGVPHEWPAPLWTGVYGLGGLDANSRGVTGKTEAGRGVNGVATTGRGVHGQATTGIGLFGTATTGLALRAVGRVRLDNCAGVATVASGQSAVTVTPGIDLVSTSAVVATLQAARRVRSWSGASA